MRTETETPTPTWHFRRGECEHPGPYKRVFLGEVRDGERTERLYGEQCPACKALRY